MKIFSKHRRKIEPKRRFGSMEFRSKIKAASNYKRVFNPTGGFSLRIFPTSGLFGKTVRVVGILIFLFVAYYLIISPTLLITDISVSGNRQVSMEQIENTLASKGDERWMLIKKNNFFLMSKGRVNEILIENIPTVKEVVNINRSWPNKIQIEIVEHTPGFVIQSNGNYFLVDEEGVVVEQISDIKKILLVEDQLVESFARGEILPNQKLAPFILSMNKSWNSKVSTPIASVKFPGKSSKEVQFVTTTGWAVLFDTNRAVSVQLKDLSVILSKQIKPQELANLSYIDLRLNKWAYYCFKASPCEQQENPAEAGTNIETNVTE